ncbi:MAG: hypothetical protein PHN31_04710 [Candidatus Gracilibacteria bacterium]|nr:hypothetical protein [Candidatus Gracilibacteria bacterium]
MRKNIKAESLAGVLVSILLLGFISLGLYELIFYSNQVNDTFEDNSNILLLKNNTLNVLYKINTNNILEGEDFYIYKDNIAKEFRIYTGSTNLNYMYIDKYGENIDDISTYNQEIYKRIVNLKKYDSTIKNKAFEINIKRYYK